MKTNWKKIASTVVISSALLTSGYSVLAAEAPAPVQTTAKYKLDQSLQVEIKSLLNERTSDGTRIGAVIRMINNGTKITRVPEYELRVKTNDGIEYTLQPSATNARSIQPKSQVELSYLSLIDRKDAFSISKLSWVDVDLYTYPKKETWKLTVPVAGMVWSGSHETIKDPALIKKWGESFQIQSVHSPLTYTPVSLTKDFNNQDPVTVVKLLVDNPGKFRETVPAFSIEGITDKKVFSAQRAEQGDIVLEPGEKRYIHYAIATEQDTVLKSLNIVTLEQFVPSAQQGQTTPVSYSVGRVSILLPDGANSIDEHAVPYKLNDPIVFDPLNDLIHPDVDVSLVELTMHENDGVGYKTAIGKFKLTNKSDRPLPVPLFQAELASPDGYSYSGSRQVTSTQTLMPNLSHIVSYSFTVPSSETGEHLTLRLQDNRSAAPYKSTIAALNVAAQEPDTGTNLLHFYPFDVKVNYWTLNAFANFVPSVSYSYKLKLDLEITQQEKVVVDQDFSKIKFEIVDSMGRAIGEETLSFTTNLNGHRKLTSGETIIDFTGLRTEQLESPLTVNVYETIQTPSGEAKRLVTTFKR